MKGRWKVPWTVDKIRGPVNYRIVRQNNKMKQDRLLFHHDRVTPYHIRSDHLTTKEQKQDSSAAYGGREGAFSKLDQSDGMTNDDHQKDVQFEAECDDDDDEPSAGSD